MSGTVGNTTQFHDAENKHKMFGVVIGVVTNNNDPKHGHRVQVRLPHLPGGGEKDKDQQSTNWARVSTFHAGQSVGTDNSHSSRGAFFMPEVGDEVIIAFEQGDVSRPLVIGSLWSDVAPDHQSGGGDSGSPNAPPYHHGDPTKKGKKNSPTIGPNGTSNSNPDTPHAPTKHEKGKNDLSGFISRTGSQITFNDNQEGAAIYIRTHAGHRLEIVDGGGAGHQGVLLVDAAENHIWMKSTAGGGDIEIKTQGNILLQSEKNITLKAKQKIITESESDTSVTAKGKLDMHSKGAMTLKTDATGEITATGSLTVKGNPLNLN